MGGGTPQADASEAFKAAVRQQAAKEYQDFMKSRQVSANNEQEMMAIMQRATKRYTEFVSVLKGEPVPKTETEGVVTISDIDRWASEGYFTALPTPDVTGSGESNVSTAPLH
jgi:hypothetical protein